MKLIWTPDDLTISSLLTLVDSSRSVAEHDVRTAGHGLVETADVYQALFAANLYRFNEKSPLSFSVQRDCDFNNAPFKDPEAAFLFSTLHCSGKDKGTAVRGTGTLTMILTGKFTTATLIYANA